MQKGRASRASSEITTKYLTVLSLKINLEKLITKLSDKETELLVANKQLAQLKNDKSSVTGSKEITLIKLNQSIYLYKKDSSKEKELKKNTEIYW